MVGSAVAMMVWFNAARNAASISPKKILRTSAWLIGPDCTAADAAAGVDAPGVAVAARSAPRPRRPRTLRRTRARARNAAREKFIGANNPDARQIRRDSNVA